MTQKWTSKAPDRDGFWWWKLGNEAGVVKVKVFSVNEVYTENEYGDLSHIAKWKSYSWGDSPIQEPVGEKI